LFTRRSHQPKEFIMRKKFAVALITLVVLSGASTLLTACNTVAGAGKDVSKAGSEVTEEANEHK
jgi:predicted small secreted protein